MNVKRMTMLYQMMDGIPAERVNLSLWRSRATSDEELIHGCGSLACTLGWACTYPPFKSMGLYFAHGSPQYKCQQDFDAAALFFGITDMEALGLFTGGLSEYDPEEWDNDKERALGRIKKFMTLKGVL